MSLLKSKSTNKSIGNTAEISASSFRTIALVLGLSSLFFLLEFTFGLLSGSLALLADAGHMLSDISSLGLALLASWLAQKPARLHRTYGNHRAEVLAALGQGLLLLVTSALILREAYGRLWGSSEVEVPGETVLLVATAGLSVNILCLFLLRREHSHNLNLRGAWLHILGDMLGSIGAIVAGIAILWFEVFWVDTVASVFISILILISALYLLRDVIDVLMEAAPRNLDVREIEKSLKTIASVKDVHDLHVWTIGTRRIALSCHIVVLSEEVPSSRLLEKAYETLGRNYGISHATIQIETQSFSHHSPESYCNG